ncbi:MAG: hypothetical protein IPM16_21650 [Chloroflexi bacterium]|nr:hypothetical protein [Chloroflexota bacterium]
MSSTATVPHSVPEPHSRPLSVLAFAWIVTLAVSFMPDILITELRIDWPIPLLWTKVIALAFFFGITFVWAEVRALRFYFILFATLTLATGLTTWVAGTEFWRGTFTGSGFTARMLPEQLLRLIVALIVLAALFAIYRRGERFFSASAT